MGGKTLTLEWSSFKYGKQDGSEQIFRYKGQKGISNGGIFLLYEMNYNSFSNSS